MTLDDLFEVVIVTGGVLLLASAWRRRQFAHSPRLEARAVGVTGLAVVLALITRPEEVAEAFLIAVSLWVPAAVVLAVCAAIEVAIASAPDVLRSFMARMRPTARRRARSRARRTSEAGV